MNSKRTLLDKLREQRLKLEIRIKNAEEKQKKQQQKKEARMKQLIGEYYYQIFVQEGKMQELKNIMSGYLSQASDRKIFDLSTEHETEKS